MMWTLTAISLLPIIPRFTFRARKQQIGWDDFFMGTTWVCEIARLVRRMLTTIQACFVGWSTVLTLYAHRGGCQHIWDVQKRGTDNLTRVILLNWTSQIFGIVGVATGKISIAALLLSIIRNTGWTWQRIYLWTVTIILTSCVAISCSLLTFLQCNPPSRLWDPRVEGICIGPEVMAASGIFTGCKLDLAADVLGVLTSLAFFTFADASLAIIPATIFWKLRISVLQRIQLCIVFGLNILTSVCSGIKTQYLAELGNRTDQTWATYDIFAWVTAELFLLVVCGTVPTLHPLLHMIQSLLIFIRGKIRRRDCSSDEVLKPSDEVLTVGRIRMRLAQTTDKPVDVEESEAQPPNREGGGQWRIRAR